MNVVLFVEASLPPVSRANLRLYKLGCSLVKNGYNVHMIVPSFYPHKRENLVFDGILVHQYPGFAAFLYSKIRLLVRLLHLILSVIYTLLLRKRMEIYVIHGWNPLAGLAAILSGKLIKCPVFIDFTDFYSDIARTDSPFTVPGFEFIERYILQSATKVVVVSSIMKSALIHYYGISPSKISIIPDGTDKEIFNPNVSGARVRNLYKLNESPILIYHGDIKPPDGVDILLIAFANIVKRIPDAILLILGGGGDHFRDLKKLVKELNIENSVIFTGWVPHKSVPEYIATADAGVMPLRATLNHNCYISFKLFEYWGIGKPVVASKVKAISKIIKNGSNGLLVQPENVEELSKALLTILTHKEIGRAMGKEGRRLVEEKYNWDRLMDKETELYI